MGAMICKQPNGKYCRFSTVTDTITHWDMTAEDYIELCKQRAEQEARMTLEHNLFPFEGMITYFVPNNESVEDFNTRLRAMGYKGKLVHCSKTGVS